MKEEEKNHETTGKKTTLTDKIYQDIKDDILTKVFQPGEKLNIKELAREYQVSDTPVKQALQRLAEEKLVVNTPNKGMSVRALTPHELQDIFDMRQMMDTFFVKENLEKLIQKSKTQTFPGAAIPPAAAATLPAPATLFRRLRASKTARSALLRTACATVWASTTEICSQRLPPAATTRSKWWSTAAANSFPITCFLRAAIPFLVLMKSRQVPAPDTSVRCTPN